MVHTGAHAEGILTKFAYMQAMTVLGKKSKQGLIFTRKRQKPGQSDFTGQSEFFLITNLNIKMPTCRDIFFNYR